MIRAVKTEEEKREAKTNKQRERRASLKAEGKDPYKNKKISPEQKEINKKIRIQRQKEWFSTEEGKSFKDRQSNRLKKYESVEDRDKAANDRKKEKRRSSLDYNLQYRLNGCKNRAKKEGLPFDLDFDYIKSIYSDTCPYLGIKLNLMSTSGNSMDALSIDKIVPSLGYIKGNIRLVSYKANVMKQDVDIDTLKAFAKSVLRIHGD